MIDDDERIKDRIDGDHVADFHGGADSRVSRARERDERTKKKEREENDTVTMVACGVVR